MEKYLYIKHDEITVLDNILLSSLRERHKITLIPSNEVIKDNLNLVLNNIKPDGIIFEMSSGVPSRAQVKTCQKILRNRQYAIWFYWASEQAIESIDLDLLNHYHFVRKLITFLNVNKLLVFPILKFLYKTVQKARKRKANHHSVNSQPIYESYSTFNKDHYKNETQKQWDHNPCGSQYVESAELHTLAWYQEVEKYRYQSYAPWMRHVMEFENFKGNQVLEIGSGIGTDLAQFAKYGAHVTDVDLSYGHLTLAKENFTLRELPGNFCHGDAENLPFQDNSFDLIYSNGVIHHTPKTENVVQEMWRVLKPGGRLIVMVYARNSFFYWKMIIIDWFLTHRYKNTSIGELLSMIVEKTDNNAKPLVKVYSKSKLRTLFKAFNNIEIIQQQLTKKELLMFSKLISAKWLSKFIGWNLVIKAHKSPSSGSL